MKRFVLGSLMSLLATSSFADTQNYFPSAYRGVTEDASVLASGTTPQDMDTEIGTKGVNVILSSTQVTSASLQLRTSKGVVIQSETITLGLAPVSRTFLPPLFNYDFKVSPTGVGTGALSGSNTKVWELPNYKPVGHSLAYNGGVPRHPNCRSTEIAVLTEQLGGEPAEDMGFEEFLEDKSAAQVAELLGKGKADLYRAGKITLNDLVDQQGRGVGLSELLTDQTAGPLAMCSKRHSANYFRLVR